MSIPNPVRSYRQFTLATGSAARVAAYVVASIASLFSACSGDPPTAPNPYPLPLTLGSPYFDFVRPGDPLVQPHHPRRAFLAGDEETKAYYFFDYDSDGRLFRTVRKGGTPYTIDFEYDDGKLVHTSRAGVDPVMVTYAYRGGRLIHEQSIGTVPFDAVYEYSSGRLTRRTQTFTNPHVSTYEYDASGRVARELRHTPDLSDAAPIATTYEYDEDGRIIARHREGSDAESATFRYAKQCDARNCDRYYDVLQEETPASPDTPPVSYRYDAKGRVTNIGDVTICYNADDCDLLGHGGSGLSFF